MSESRVAKRYAEAFFELMTEKGLLNDAEEDLQRVVQLTQEVGELERLLVHRGISSSEKKQLLRRVFEGQVGPLVLNFILVLCDRHREGYLTEIYWHFHNLSVEASGIAEVEAVSALPLTDEQVKALKKRLSAVTGREVRLQLRVEPGLLGGMTVKIGDKVFDGSIAQRLRKLEEHIKGLSIEDLKGDKAV